MKQNELFNKCCENIDPKTREEVWKQMDKELGREENRGNSPKIPLSEFEKNLERKIKCYTGIVQTENAAKQWAKELMSLAKKEQKKPTLDDPDLYGDWDKDLLKEIHSWLGNLDGKYTPYTIDDIKLTARHFVEWQKQEEQKPAEWSEEDEDMLNRCISSIDEAKENRYYYKETDGDTSYDEEIKWLKSLRPQPHWKPSEDAFKAGAEWQKKQVSEYLDKWMEHAIRGSEKGNHIYHLGKIDLILAIQEWLKEEEMR